AQAWPPELQPQDQDQAQASLCFASFALRSSSTSFLSSPATRCSIPLPFCPGQAVVSGHTSEKKSQLSISGRVLTSHLLLLSLSLSLSCVCVCGCVCDKAIRHGSF
ncbi:Hypothetical predicted protein, partial [Drosophila guanche]